MRRGNGKGSEGKKVKGGCEEEMREESQGYVCFFALEIDVKKNEA